MFKGGVLGNDNREMEMTFVNGLFMLCYVLDIDGYDGTIGMVITVLKWTWNWDRSRGDGVIEIWWDERLME